MTLQQLGLKGRLWAEEEAAFSAVSGAGGTQWGLGPGPSPALRGFWEPRPPGGHDVRQGWALTQGANL